MIKMIVRKILLTFENVISSWENSKAPLTHFILTFLFIGILRSFIEVFSDMYAYSLDIPGLRFLHYFLFYLFLALSIVLLFYVITKTDVSKVIKVVFPTFIVVIIAPLADLIISSGKGYDMSYMLPGVHQNLILRFFTFFGDFPGFGVTPGIRIEIALVLFMAFIYFYLKTSNLIKSVFGTFLLYTLIFLNGALPIFLNAILSFMGLTYKYSDLLIFNSYLLLSFTVGTILAYFVNKDYFIIILKDIRLSRLLHFEFMFILGVVLGLTNTTEFTLDSSNLFSFFFIPISIVFACLYSIMSNNLEDIDIDKISNKKRPLINSNMNYEVYSNIAWVFLIMALVYALSVNFITFFLILLFIGNYFLYSVQPLRLKRLPLLSKLLIALNSLILVMAGFLLINSGSLLNFPTVLFPIFLVCYTLVLNFIDIKDYEGDKKAGILTLPVLLGLQKSKFVIGIFFIFTYLSFYFIIERAIMIIPLLILGITQFYLINKKEYDEKYIFCVYLFSLILLFIYLLLF